jgi:hypothetical protein
MIRSRIALAALLVAPTCATASDGDHVPRPILNAASPSVATFDFQRPMGIALGAATCSEIVEKLGQPLRRNINGDYRVDFEHNQDWSGSIHLGANCGDMYKPLESITVYFTPTPAGRGLEQMRSTANGLFRRFARRLTQEEPGWELTDQDIAGPDFLQVELRSERVFVQLVSSHGSVFAMIASLKIDPLRQAAIQKAAVQPFGVAIGVSTCREASIALRAKPSQPMPAVLGQRDTTTTVTAPNPSRLYPNAELLQATCYDGPDAPVDDLVLYVKDSNNNASAQEAYRTLAAKYKRIEGGPVPRQGPSYVRFVNQGVAIELEVRGGGKDFIVQYTEKTLFDQLRDARAKKRKSL